MKALITSKRKGLIALTVIFITSLLVTSAAIACRHYYYHHHNFYRVPISVPTATCVAHNTQLPLPEYVCCKLAYKHHHKWHVAWRNKWVPESCSNANPHARYSLGCTTASEVYGMGSPIIGNCQFSASTNRYK